MHASIFTIQRGPTSALQLNRPSDGQNQGGANEEQRREARAGNHQASTKLSKSSRTPEAHLQPHKRTHTETTAPTGGCQSQICLGQLGPSGTVASQTLRRRITQRHLHIRRPFQPSPQNYLGQLGPTGTVASQIPRRSSSADHGVPRQFLARMHASRSTLPRSGGSPQRWGPNELETLVACGAVALRAIARRKRVSRAPQPGCLGRS